MVKDDMQRKRRVVVVSSRISRVYVGKRKRQVDREEKRDRKSTQIDKLGGAPLPPSCDRLWEKWCCLVRDPCYNARNEESLLSFGVQRSVK